jgi:hypothetical protein
MIDIKGQRLKEYQIVGREVLFTDQHWHRVPAKVIDITMGYVSGRPLAVMCERVDGSIQSLLITGDLWWFR